MKIAKLQYKKPPIELLVCTSQHRSSATDLMPQQKL